MLVPLDAAEMDPIAPAELAAWVEVVRDREPEVAGHEWRIELDDEVGLLVDQDTVDLAQLLNQQVGVESVVQLDREVLVVHAPTLCADGLRAAVVESLAWANRMPDAGGQLPPTDAGSPREAGGVRPTPGIGSPDGSPGPPDDACLLVGEPVHHDGRIVQVWVCQDGILILPEATLSRLPPRQWRRMSAEEGVRLAEQHDGLWIDFASVAQVRLQRPGLVNRSWRATFVEQQGRTVRFRWSADPRQVLTLWAYTVAQCGLEKAGAMPLSRSEVEHLHAVFDSEAAGDS